ncbi:hypothetical protein PM082_024906 [Marasmius tenuissimus]|nr:hypothetical protein PM082_024906 [Marasmius tenuissimus]
MVLRRGLRLSDKRDPSKEKRLQLGDSATASSGSEAIERKGSRETRAEHAPRKNKTNRRLQISPKCDSDRVRTALDRANEIAYVATYDPGYVTPKHGLMFPPI